MNTRRGVTIKDIAEHVGVSNMTVSLVLHGDHERRGRVSEATRLRVRSAASELGYQPNAVARSLRQRQTNTFGFYTGPGRYAPNGTFQNELLIGLRYGCDAHGKDLLLHHRRVGASPEDDYRAFGDGRVDGLVIWTDSDDPLIPRLIDAKMPLIAIADPVPGIPCVRVDDAAGAIMTAEYLAERGHRKVMYRSSHLARTSAYRREGAFIESAAARGIEVIVMPEGVGYQVTEAEAEVLRRPRGERPSAVVGWHDYSAYLMIAHCQACGLNVPDDIAVVGFSGLQADSMPRRLTSVRAPNTEQGVCAIGLLADLAGGIPVADDTMLPVEFIAGDTA